MNNGPAVDDEVMGFVHDESFELARQLLELTDMRAQGTISEEEFAQWKDELLPS